MRSQQQQRCISSSGTRGEVLHGQQCSSSSETGQVARKHRTEIYSQAIGPYSSALPCYATSVQSQVQWGVEGHFFFLTNDV
jgi:hypothetical protein